MLSWLKKPFQSKNENLAEAFYNELFKKSVWFQDKQGAHGDERKIQEIIQEYDFYQENKKKKNNKLLSIILASVVRKLTFTEENCSADLDFEIGIIYELLERGANPNTRFKDSKNIYEDIYNEIYQLKLDNKNVCKKAINDKIKHHHITFSGSTISSITALHIAAYLGDIGLTEELLNKYGADPNVQNSNGHTAIQFALAAIVRKTGLLHSKDKLQEVDMSSHFEVIKQLVLYSAKYVDCDHSSRCKHCFITRSITNTEIRCANKGSPYDYRPLYLAVVCNHPDAARTLIEYGAYVNFMDEFGCTLLSYAVEQGNCEIAELLIDSGAYVDFIDRSGYSLLNYAVRQGNYTLAKLLIDSDADVNFIDESGHSLLNEALEQENIELIKLLINKGANINHLHNKKTMLEHAIENKMQYISFLLLMEKYYHDMGQNLPELYQMMELCMEEALSKGFITKNTDGINEFISIIETKKTFFEAELDEWKDYFESPYVPTDLKEKLSNLCGPDRLEKIVKEALNIAGKVLKNAEREEKEKYTSKAEKIEQCSNRLKKLQLSYTIQHNSLYSLQNKHTEQNSKSRWKSIAENLTGFITFGRPDKVSSLLDQTRVSKSLVDLRNSIVTENSLR